MRGMANSHCSNLSWDRGRGRGYRGDEEKNQDSAGDIRD